MRGSAARTAGRGPEAPGVEIATRDSVHRPDPGSSADRSDPDTAPVPHQATALDLQRVWDRDAQQCRASLVQGVLKRAKKPASIRGLNRNHNHDLKNLFKSAATVAAAKPGPFQEFYDRLVAKGIRPEMARLTLERKIAAITLIIWKKGATATALGWL
jgi:hypothetical protein